jgi:hypothetical protein
MTGEEARAMARQVEHYIHGLCPGHPIAPGNAATCAHCNMSRLTLEELVWHKLRPGERRSERRNADPIPTAPCAECGAPCYADTDTYSYMRQKRAVEPTDGL